MMVSQKVDEMHRQPHTVISVQYYTRIMTANGLGKMFWDGRAGTEKELKINKVAVIAE
jgi:hypothetical protein